MTVCSGVSYPNDTLAGPQRDSGDATRNRSWSRNALRPLSNDVAANTEAQLREIAAIVLPRQSIETPGRNSLLHRQLSV